jgi:hypothetical protein
MSVQEHTRALGTRLTPVQVALVDDENDPIDLTGLSVKFYMYDDLGTLVVDGGSCTITSDENGLVQYSFAADDVDTAGVFWGYFQVYAAASPTVYDRYPAGREFRIEITEGT